MSGDVSRNSGLTLIESLLALAIGTLVMTSLTTTFRLSQDNWNRNARRLDLIQHARVAMARITYELRYATALNTVGSKLDFDAAFVADDDSDDESIEFSVVGQQLRRRVTDGAGAPVTEMIAGDNDAQRVNGRIEVTNFSCTALKRNSSGTGLEALSGSDTLDMAVAVQLDITLRDEDGTAFSLTSTVKMRNTTG